MDRTDAGGLRSRPFVSLQKRNLEVYRTRVRLGIEPEAQSPLIDSSTGLSVFCCLFFR
jgi:hypothetical protein